MKKVHYKLFFYFLFATCIEYFFSSSYKKLIAQEINDTQLLNDQQKIEFLIKNRKQSLSKWSNFNDKNNTFNKYDNSSEKIIKFSGSMDRQPLNLIASPENFNPSLRQTDITPYTPENQTENRDNFQLESITPSFYLETDNFGLRNIYREVLFDFESLNQNNFSLKTGVNTFKKTDIEDITHVPIILGWQRQINNTNLNLNLGVDIFDRVRNSPNISINAEQPLSINVKETGELQSLFVAGATIEHQAYKFNATTIENEVTFWRFRPQFYWLIAPDLSLFTFAQYGTFSDGNDEFQSFSRLEKTFGEFSLSGNLFVWSFAKNLESSSGYFSPSDFLVYNLELGWRKQFTDNLSCRLAGSIGQQRLEGEFSNAFVYEGLCQANLSPQTVLDLSYRVSNILTVESAATSYRNEQFKAQLKFNF